MFSRFYTLQITYHGRRTVCRGEGVLLWDRSIWRRDGCMGRRESRNLIQGRKSNHSLYIYWPVWRETWRFVPPRKFISPKGVALGWHEFSGWDKSSCLPTNWAINCLLYRKLKHEVIQRRAWCRETQQGNMTSGGRHDNLFSLHVTSLDQSCFFIPHINYMRNNNNVYHTVRSVMLA